MSPNEVVSVSSVTVSVVLRDTWMVFGVIWICTMINSRRVAPVAAISSKQWGDDMANAERESITGVWGRAPSGVQGQSPWSGGQGGGEAP